MAMGILSQLVNNPGTGPVTVYTVPAGKVAVFNIFTTAISSNQDSYIYINNVRISTTVANDNIAGIVNGEIKGVIGEAGTIVQFENCTGIVTGYEEDA